MAYLILTIFTLIYAGLVRSSLRIIGDQYLSRYFLIPRNRWFNIYLHKYTGSDDDRALHDHPWNSVSFLLLGSLSEVVRVYDPNGYCEMETRIKRFHPHFRQSTYCHRIILNSKTAWTLFITGSKTRDWGFHCPKGWVIWDQFTDETGNQIGKGCE